MLAILRSNLCVILIKKKKKHLKKKKSSKRAPHLSANRAGSLFAEPGLHKPQAEDGDDPSAAISMSLEADRSALLLQQHPLLLPPTSGCLSSGLAALVWGAARVVHDGCEGRVLTWAW